MLEVIVRKGLPMQTLNWLQDYWLTSDQKIENRTYETQNEDYEGMTFTISGETFRSRLAKKTPKKKGYFVVFWEKDPQNKNQPYAFLEAPNQLIVIVKDAEKQGCFLFPKEALLQQGILSSDTSKGKMALRVYPIWETDLNASAARTQKWQTKYFSDYTNK